MYWFTGILGLGIVLAPFVFNYTANPGALWTSLLIGAGVLVASFFEAMDRGRVRWEYWLAGIGGAIIFFAPLFLNFGSGSAMWTTFTLGAVLVIASAYKLFYGFK